MVEVVRLKETDYDRLLKVQEGHRPDPMQSIVIVGYDEASNIVARSMLIRPWHIEGTWVDERYRKTPLGARVILTLQDEAKAMGLTKLFSYSSSPEISDYLRRLGFKLAPATVWEKDI